MKSRRPSLIALLAPLAGLILSSGCTLRPVRLLVGGDSRQLVKRPENAPPNSPDRPAILLVALDGVDRRLLYEMLRGGELPALARLLFSNGTGFPHAYFADRYLSTLPSSTIPAWVTALTGVGAARHGIPGNEFFIRDRRQMVAAVPTTFDDTDPVIACYLDDYLNAHRRAPSVYERLRDGDPNVLIWVAMHPFYAGADRLLMTDRTVVAGAFEAFAEEQISERVNQEKSRAVFEKLDSEVIDVVVDELDDGPIPDVLTVYLSGTDAFAHVADAGPDRARRAYLSEVLDPLLARLAESLTRRNALANRWVVVTSDHGHTEVVRDEAHALATTADDPPAVLEKAGFRVRPFALEVDERDDFQAVLAYQGAMSYVYLADRSSCAAQGEVCDWSRPPRFAEDVLALAEALHRNNHDGAHVPAMRGTLDLILTRRPTPYAEDDAPFEVYVGGGRLVPIDSYLARHPHPTYVALDARLRDLAVGPHGERAGDIVLIAHNGNRDQPAERYYFASPYRSFHGSPSRQDSEIPLIVAHPDRSRASIGALVEHALGERAVQQSLTDLLLALRNCRN